MRATCPTLVNAAWSASFFWDGRAATFEQQALQPVLNPRELGMTPDRVLALARSQHTARRLSQRSRASRRSSTSARALASYVRTIEAGDTPSIDTAPVTTTGHCVPPRSGVSSSSTERLAATLATPVRC